MPRGVPLTPDELRALAELYGELGNATEVGRELGIEASTVTRQLARLGEQRRAILQGRALAVGLLRGGEFLVRLQERLGLALVGELEAGEGMRPLEVEAAINSLVKVNGGIAALDVREERRRQARHTRVKTKAEIARLTKGDVPTADQVLALLAALPREEVVKILADLRGRRGAPAEQPKPEGT